MRITVNVPLDIDVDAWVLSYGVERSKVRDDVREHARNSVTEYFRDLGLLRDTEDA